MRTVICMGSGRTEIGLLDKRIFGIFWEVSYTEDFYTERVLNGY